jgi:hypothetical protein
VHAPLPAVVRKLGPVRADVHGHELVARIPLEAAGAIAGEIPICVNGSTDVGFRDQGVRTTRRPDTRLGERRSSGRS